MTRSQKDMLCPGLSLLALTGMLGCGAGVVELTPVHVPAVPADDPFAAPMVLEIVPEHTNVFAGEISAASPVQVWDVGSMPQGTRITVDVAGQGGDFSVGLFDQDAQVLMLNHDRFGSPDPYAVLDLTRDLECLYVVVSSDPTEVSEGPYTVRLTPTADLRVEAPAAQQVILDFSGAAALTVGSLFHAQVPPFDAAQLAPGWEDRTEEMTRVVINHLRRIYEGLNVVFYLDDDPDRPEHASTVYFGSTHPHNVGLASNIDYGNRNREQVAIIYTQNFAKYIPYGYTHVDIAQGFANVAAHELGHLLGLNHSDLPADVMNVSPTVQALLAPQYFVESARLDRSVFLAGMQDGAACIFDTVGGAWDIIVQARKTSARLYAQVDVDAKARLPQADQLADVTELGSGCLCDGTGHH